MTLITFARVFVVCMHACVLVLNMGMCVYNLDKSLLFTTKFLVITKEERKL